MLFLGVVLVAAGSSLARAAEILMPPPQTAVNTDFISISARTDGPEPVPWQLLRSSGSLEQGEAAPNANNTVEFTVNLSPGLNQVRVGETMRTGSAATGREKKPRRIRVRTLFALWHNGSARSLSGYFFSLFRISSIIAWCLIFTPNSSNSLTSK